MSAVACRTVKAAMTPQWLRENRNRFVVIYYDTKYVVFGIDGNTKVSYVLAFSVEANAHELADKLNDMHEEGKVG